MKLIELMKADNLITAENAEKVLRFKAQYGGSLDSILLNLGGVTEEQLAKTYAKSLNMHFVNIDNLNDLIKKEQIKSAIDTKKLNFNFLEQNKFLLIDYSNNKFIFLTPNPTNNTANQYLLLENSLFEIHVCSESTFRNAETMVADVFATNSLSGNYDGVDIERLKELASETPIVNFVNALMSRSLQQGASDLHIEPINEMARARIRVDGVLQELDFIPANIFLAVICRIKVMADLDIAEKRRPQDGKIGITLLNKEIDIRVSTLPLNDGESIVMRFLVKESIGFDLEVLGIENDVRNKIAEDLTKTAGVVLLTGPTGSGKTTTLYSFLSQLNDHKRKIITLEDPVEYQLEGVNQIQVQADIGFDFATGLRSIVRQDPDIIMLGEIRDNETARISMQSSLTGHLVFSTVHTNDAPSAYTRLLDLGIDDFLLNAALISIIAQRLARRLCEDCKEPLELDSATVNRYNLQSLADSFNNSTINSFKPVGCPKCSFSGYKGRVAVIEYLRCDETIESLPKDADFVINARRAMNESGARDLFSDGLLKVVKGVTTIDEIVRVAG